MIYLNRQAIQCIAQYGCVVARYLLCVVWKRGEVCFGYGVACGHSCLSVRCAIRIVGPLPLRSFIIQERGLEISHGLRTYLDK